MPTLPSVLSSIDLPVPELYAARLDGELFELDECFCPIDEIEKRRHRALALAAILPARLIAEQRTAAWVFGALDTPPTRHQACANTTARARPPSVRVNVREVVIDDGDVLTLSGVNVTSPLRTAVDLARFSPVFAEEERSMIRFLAASGGFGLADCRAMLDRRRNLPTKRLAFDRLSSVLSGA